MPDWVNTLINGIIALGTLVTSLFTWRAAARAADSAKITENQFKLNEDMYNRSKNPVLLPLSVSYPFSIGDRFDIRWSRNGILTSNTSDFPLNISNVGIGNAYNVKASVTLVNIDEFTSLGVSVSPPQYSVFNSKNYSLALTDNRGKKLLQLDLTLNPEIDRSNPSGLLRPFYYADSVSYQSVLRSEENLIIQLNTYVLLILKQYIIMKVLLPKEKFDFPKPILKLDISYRNEQNLSFGGLNTNTYFLNFSEMRISKQQSSFRIDYDPKP